LIFWVVLFVSVELLTLKPLTTLEVRRSSLLCLVKLANIYKGFYADSLKSNNTSDFSNLVEVPFVVIQVKTMTCHHISALRAGYALREDRNVVAKNRNGINGISSG
jgi:hypothetical protein